MLFVNACIYLHKISTENQTPSTTEDQNPSDYYKLRDMPIFEYLKANNFLMLDKFLLNANSNLKPPSIIFWTIVGIVLGSLILLGIHYWFLSKNSELLEYNKNIKFEEFIIIGFPYYFITIIAIMFNIFQVINIGKLVHDIKKVNLFLHKLNPHEEYKKNMNKITPYEDIISENIHEHVGKNPQPHAQHLSNNMKINDSIGIRKLQLNISVKRFQPQPQQGQLDVLSTTKLTRSRHNRTQRINVIKI
jgi:hypothetical protein